MNYRELLFKYMQHLYKVEESTFLELLNSPFSPKVHFTAEELRALREMEEELHIRFGELL